MGRLERCTGILACGLLVCGGCAGAGKTSGGSGTSGGTPGASSGGILGDESCTATLCRDPSQCPGWDGGTVALPLIECLNTAQYSVGGLAIVDLTFSWDQGNLQDDLNLRIPGPPATGTFTDASAGVIEGAAALGTGANDCYWASPTRVSYFEAQAGVDDAEPNPDGGAVGSFSLTLTSVVDGGEVTGGPSWNYAVSGSAHLVCMPDPSAAATGVITLDVTF